jgi:hypothetical protein
LISFHLLNYGSASGMIIIRWPKLCFMVSSLHSPRLWPGSKNFVAGLDKYLFRSNLFGRDDSVFLFAARFVARRPDGYFEVFFGRSGSLIFLAIALTAAVFSGESSGQSRLLSLLSTRNLIFCASSTKFFIG